MLLGVVLAVCAGCSLSTPLHGKGEGGAMKIASCHKFGCHLWLHHTRVVNRPHLDLLWRADSKADPDSGE